MYQKQGSVRQGGQEGVSECVSLDVYLGQIEETLTDSWKDRRSGKI